MEDLIASLPVLAITVIVIIAIFWFTNQTKKQEEIKIRHLTEIHNWFFEPIQETITWGYRIKGPQWNLESYSQSKGVSNDSGSSNIFKTTLWKTEAVSLPEHSVLIMPRLSQNIPDIGTPLINKVLQTLFGDQAAGLTEVLFENSPLKQRYIVFAHHAMDAQHLLSSNRQQSLVTWNTAPPVIKLSSQGLQIELQGVHLEEPGDILQLIQLGEIFIKEEEK
jgi:hypothetical protein